LIPDWFIQQLVAFPLGLLTFIIGFYLSFKYIVPKMSRDTAISTAEAILEHPKVKPAITKLKELEPLLEKAKELDLQELVDMAKGLKVFVEVQNKKKPPPPPSPKK